MSSDPEDQSVNPANSEVVLNCVAFFYEEGKGGGGGGEITGKKTSSVVW